QENAPIASISCCFQGVAPTIWPAFRSWRLSPPTDAAQHTTAPIMIAATAPIGELCGSRNIRITEANRMVQMVMPETGLLEEPTRPARYAETETNRNPATTMISAIGMLTDHCCTIAW